MVEYREIQPHPLIKPYVDCYWQIISTRGRIHPTYDHIFPDGSLDIIFNLGAPMLSDFSETVIDRDAEAQVASFF